MNAYRAEATVDEDGTVTVRGVPFASGVRVEILVQRIESPASDTGHRYPLRGSVYRYDRPFDPAVDPDEWEANR